MWNIFKKSKVKQLKEITAEAAVRYLYDLSEKYTEKLLENKDVDSAKIYRMLASNCDIAGVSDEQICFVKDYTYRIERINEKVYDSNLKAEIEVPKYCDFTISGDFYCEDLRELTRTIKLVIRNKIDRVDVFATIVSWQTNNEVCENFKVKADIVFRTPFQRMD